MGRKQQPLCVEALCRGEGTGYALLRADERWESLDVRVLARGIAVPGAAYAVDDWKDREVLCPAGGEAWVVTFPLLDLDLDLRVSSAGTELAHFGFPVGVSKVRSRLLTKRKPDVAKALRGFETRGDTGHTQVRIAEVWPNSNNMLSWRIRACFPTASEGGSATLRVCRRDGQAADVPVITMEDHVVPSEHDATQLVRLVTFSCLMSRDFGSFYVEARLEVPDLGAGEWDALVGFAAHNGPLTGAMAWEKEQWMRGAVLSPHYGWWWFEDRRATRTELIRQRAVHRQTPGPLISVVLRVRDASRAELDAAIQSVLSQSYESWELLVAGPHGAALAASAGDKRVRASVAGPTFGEDMRQALVCAEGDYVALMDGWDVLEPDALHHVCAALRRAEDADLVYTDEDRMTLADGHVHTPVFKTGPNYGKLCGYPYVGHLMVASRRLFGQIGQSDQQGGEAVACEVADCDALEYDIALRAMELGWHVEHVPRVLCHRLREAYATCDQGAGRAVLAAHHARRGIAAEVVDGPLPSTYRVRYELPRTLPRISIVIPTKDQAPLLRTCVTSILERTTYADYEVVLVENNSTRQETFELYDELRARSERVCVVVWRPEVPGDFNYSAVINEGVRHATGEVLMLLNNDTEVIEPRWLEEMLGCLSRPEVGVVGAKLLFGDGLVQHVGMFANGSGDFAHVAQNVAADAEGPDRVALFPGDYSMVTGACQMVSRKLFDELGGYDEELAVGFNDGDFCLRAWEAGRSVTVCVTALLHHREFATRGRESADVRLRERYLAEKALVTLKHPAFFAAGDWTINPNLDPWSSFMRIRESGAPDV